MRRLYRKHATMTHVIDMQIGKLTSGCIYFPNSAFPCTIKEKDINIGKSACRRKANIGEEIVRVKRYFGWPETVLY